VAVVWSSSAGLSLTWTEKKVSPAPTRSSRSAPHPTARPATRQQPAASFSSVIAAAASIECSATRRFSAENPAILETIEFIAL